MSIQNLSLFLADRVSRRRIYSKLLELNKFYGIKSSERKEIIHKKISFTLKNAYENVPYYYDLAEKYNIKEIFLNFKIDNLKDIPSINKNILRFESSNDNVNSLCKFIKTYYNDDNFISKIKIFEKLLDNIDHKKIPNSLKHLFSTLNMSLHMN